MGKWWGLVHHALVVLIIHITYGLSGDDEMVFSITEELPIGTLVGKLSTTVSDPVKYVQYGYTDVFSVDVDTGNVFLVKVLDYETLSKIHKRKGFHFYTSVGSIRNVSVVVRIKDINDNDPMFGESYGISIEQNAKAGFSIEIPSALDADQSGKALVIYKITSGPPDLVNKFELKYVREKNKLLLLLKTKINKKPGDEFELLISACDSEFNERCSTLVLQVVITHAKHPHFQKQTYSTQVRENVKLGTVITQVKAFNENSGASTEGIEYSMFGHHPFAVHPLNGMVRVIGVLDAETRAFYTLMVIAKYNGGSPVTCQVTVSVLDRNDNKPEIVVKYLRKSGAYAVIEGSRIKTKVLSLKTFDRDRDSKNNKVSLRLLNGNGYFRLRNNSKNAYFLLVNKMIDRELTPRFVLKFVAHDNGVPRLETTREVTILVGDVNDNVPIFKKHSTSIRLNESTAIGTEVLTVDATDLDIGNNRVISYRITHQSRANWFTINERNGTLSVGSELDREIASHVVVTISASDHGEPALSTSTNINITILDANDNSPYFAPSEVSFNVTENNVVPFTLGKTFIG